MNVTIKNSRGVSVPGVVPNEREQRNVVPM